MKTIIIRKSDFSNPVYWYGILQTLNLPKNVLDGQWDDLTLTIAQSTYINNNRMEVVKSY